MQFQSFIKDHWVTSVAIIGLVASILGIYSFVTDASKNKNSIPVYSGAFDKNFATFLWENSEQIIKLELQFDEKQSEEINDWIQDKNGDRTIFLGISHDTDGTEFGFFRDDPELHLNTRHSFAIHTNGYFKVHSTQGPYQGWMSVTLKGVGIENIPNRN